MAVFTPTLNPTSDPSYLGMNQGISKPESLGGLQAFATGLGSAVSTGVTAVHAGIVEQIDDLLRKDIKPKFDEATGVGDVSRAAAAGWNATGAKGDNTNPYTNGSIANPDGSGNPLDANASVVGAGVSKGGKGNAPGVERLGATLGRLQDAYSTGQLSESYVQGQAVAAIKQVKAQFPGFEDVIDEKVKSIFGNDPANVLRKSVQADLDSASRFASSAAKDDLHFIDQKAKYAPELALAVRDAVRAGGPAAKPLLDVFRQRVFDSEAQEQKIQAQTHLMTMNASQGKNVSDHALSTSTLIANTIVAQAIQRSADGQGANISFESLNRLSKDPNLKNNPEQILQGKAALDNFDRTLRFAIYQEMTRTDANGGSLTSYSRDPKELENRVDQAMLPVKILQEAWTNQNSGLMNWSAVYAKLRADTQWANTIDNNQLALNLAVARDKFGDKLLELTTIGGNGRGPSDPSMLNDQTQVIRGAVQFRVHGVPDGQVPPGMGRILDEAKSRYMTVGGSQKDADKLDAVVIQDAVQTVLTAKDDRKVLDYTKVLFNPDQTNFLDRYEINDAKKTRAKIYYDLTSPAFTEKVWKATRADGGEWINYKTWSMSSGQALFRTYAGQINDAQEKDRFNFTWNAKTNQVDVQPKPEYARFYQGTPQSGYSDRRMKTIVADTNRMLANLVPILGRDGNTEEVNTALLATLQGMGVNLTPQTAAEAKNPLTQLGMSIMGGMKGVPILPGDQPVDPHIPRPITVSPQSPAPAARAPASSSASQPEEITMKGQGTQASPYEPHTRDDFGEIPEGAFYKDFSGKITMKGR